MSDVGDVRVGFQSGLVNNLSRYICDLVLIGRGLVTTETRVQSSTETRVWCLVSHIIASHKADKVTGPESHLALAPVGVNYSLHYINNYDIKFKLHLLHTVTHSSCNICIRGSMCFRYHYPQSTPIILQTQHYLFWDTLRICLKD